MRNGQKEACLVEDFEGKLGLPKGRCSENKEPEILNKALYEWKRETLQPISPMKFIEFNDTIKKAGFEFRCAIWNEALADPRSTDHTIWQVTGKDKGKIHRAGWFPIKYRDNRLSKWESALLRKVANDQKIQSELLINFNYAIGTKSLPEDRDMEAISRVMLAAAPPEVQKEIIGDKLYYAIKKHQPTIAGKLTGMLLVMDNNDLLELLESDLQLQQKIREALHVLTKPDEPEEANQIMINNEWQTQKKRKPKLRWIPIKECVDEEEHTKPEKVGTTTTDRHGMVWKVKQKPTNAEDEIRTKVNGFLDAQGQWHTSTQIMKATYANGRRKWVTAATIWDHQPPTAGTTETAPKAGAKNKDANHKVDDHNSDDSQPSGRPVDPCMNHLDTVTEIGQRIFLGRERELVAWRNEDDEEKNYEEKTLEEGSDEQGNNEEWDQFKQTGLKTGTYVPFSDELYTTRLDYNLITKEKQQAAETIAKEIEDDRAHDGEKISTNEDEESEQ